MRPVLQICFVTIPLVLMGICVASAHQAKLTSNAIQRDIQGLITVLRGDTKEDRSQALLTLVNLGHDAKPALPILVEILTNLNDEERVLAVIAIGNIGKAALPELTPLLEHDDELVRLYAIWGLGLIGHDARESAPQVLKGLRDPEHELRAKAAFALPRIGTTAEQAVPELIAAFKDESTDVVQTAQQAIARYGKQALPYLEKALEDPHTAYHAIGTLLDMGPEASAAIPALCRWFKHSDAEGHDTQFAMWALREISKSSSAQLAIVMKDKDAMVRIRAVMAAGEHGAGGAPLLHYALLDPDPEVRACAANCLLNHSLPDTKSRLRQLLADPNPEVRHAAYQALTRLGDDPASLLRTDLKSGDKYAVFCAAGLLFTNSPADAESGAAALVSLLKDANLEYRFGATFILATRGKTVVEANGQQSEKNGYAHAGIESILVDHLKNAKASDRDLAANALRHLGIAGEHLPTIYKALTVDDKKLQLAALLALHDAVPQEYCGPPDKLGQRPEPADHRKRADAGTTLPAIVPLLKHKDRKIRFAALTLLRTFGPDAVPHLPFVMADPDGEIRNIAFNALLNSKGSAGLALPLLRKLAKEHERDEGIHFHFVAALALLAWEQCFPFVLETLQHKDAQFRLGIKDVEPNPGESKEVFAGLVKNLDAADPEKCRRAAYALHRLGALLTDEKTQDECSDAVVRSLKKRYPDIAKRMKSANAKTRLQALELLTQLVLTYGALRASAFGDPALEELGRNYRNLVENAIEDADLEVRRAARKILRPLPKKWC